MKIEFVSDIPSALERIQDFLMDGGAASLPEFVRGKMREASASSSPVDRIVLTAEALYSAKDELKPDALALVAVLAQFAAGHDFHGLATRGPAMADAVRRISGEKAVGRKWPEAKNDPDPLPQFVQVVEAEVAPEDVLGAPGVPAVEGKSDAVAPVEK